MKKTAVILTALLLCIGCTSQETDSLYLKEISEIYSLALCTLIETEEELNQSMTYIAVDTASLKNTTEKDIAAILEALGYYGVDVTCESLESLRDKGQVGPSNEIDGILLTLSLINVISDEKIIIEASKFRSGKAAIGIKMILVKEEMQWRLEKVEKVWVS